MRTSLVLVQVLVVEVVEQQPFLKQQLEFHQEFQVAEDVDADNVFDNVLVDDDHVVYTHLVDVDNHFKFVTLRIVDLDNDFVFVDNFVVYFVDIFVVVVEIDQLVVVLVGLVVDCNFVGFCYGSFFVDMVVGILVVVDLVVVLVDCNFDYGDVVFDSIGFDHIAVVAVHIVVDFVDIVVVGHIAVEHIVVAVAVGHNSWQDIIAVVVECIEQQYCNSCNIRSKIQCI